LITFEASGHVPQEEKPDESATAVREFLQPIIEGSALPALPEIQCQPDERC